MDAVKAFNAEILSMMDMKPPISRAKMMSITKAGIKAIKLYKHVVQIIEKFIKRCGPELKVPGLYVVDSIIRQSRHQFGEDKDVFGPRFLKNMTDTFYSLYQCPPDEKAKILRVLNLWQKNSVFSMDVIQPLLDMATAPVTPVVENGATLEGSPSTMVSTQLPPSSMSVSPAQAVGTGLFSDSKNVGELPQMQNMSSIPHLQNPPAVPQLQIPAVLPQQQITAALPLLQNPAARPQLQNPAAHPQLQNPAALPQLQNPAPHVQLQNLAAHPQLQNPVAQPQLQNPTVLPQLQNPDAFAAVAQFLQSTQSLDLQQVLQTLQQGGTNVQQTASQQTATQHTASSQEKSTISKVLLDRFDYDEEPEMVEEPKQEETPPASSASVNFMDLQQALQTHLLGQLSSQVLPNVQAALQTVAAQSVSTSVSGSVSGSALTAGQPVFETPLSQPHETPQNETHGLINAELPDSSVEFSQSRREERDEKYSRRSRSRSPRRRLSPRSQRSRSGSRSRRSRFHRSRSRSRERRRGSPRSRTDDRRERERRHKGLPPIKRETLSVCSTTLWIGQLDKKTQQQDIANLMEDFGQIESINMIPPRGCAYIVMVHRQDASSALTKLSRGSARISHKPFKIAWALNKGVNSRFKKYWDVELGVTYIPWSKLKTAEIPSLREGGTLDQDTFKPDWVSELEGLLKPAADNRGVAEGEQSKGAAVAAAGSQVPVVSVNTGGSPVARIPAMTTTPPHTNSQTTDPPEASSTRAPENSINSPGAPQTSSTPAGTVVGPGPLPHPTGPLPPFSPLFPSNMTPNLPHPNMPHPNMPHPNMPHPNMPHPNIPNQNMPHPNMPHPNMPNPNMPNPNMPNPNMPNPNMPHPNMPHPNMPQPTMPRGPAFREGCPRPPGPMGPMRPARPPGPPVRFRMPISGPHEGFPPPRERFPPPRERFPPPRERFPPPREGFTPSGPMEEGNWDHGPVRNGSRFGGPNRFGEEPPFRRGGWGRGGPRSRGHF